MTIPANPQPNVPSVDNLEVADDAVILDVRNQDEWDAGHAPGAVHIPSASLPDRLDEVPTDAGLAVTCRGGGRLRRRLPHRQGREVRNLVGGMSGWEQAGKPAVTDDGAPGSVKLICGSTRSRRHGAGIGVELVAVRVGEHHPEPVVRLVDDRGTDEGEDVGVQHLDPDRDAVRAGLGRLLLGEQDRLERSVRHRLDEGDRGDPPGPGGRARRAPCPTRLRWPRGGGVDDELIHPLRPIVLEHERRRPASPGLKEMRSTVCSGRPGPRPRPAGRRRSGRRRRGGCDVAPGAAPPTAGSRRGPRGRAAQGHPAPLVGRAVLQTQCPSPETAHPTDVVCVDDEFAISGQVHALHGNGCDTRPNNRGLCVSLGIVLEEPIG